MEVAKWNSLSPEAKEILYKSFPEKVKLAKQWEQIKEIENKINEILVNFVSQFQKLVDLFRTLGFEPKVSLTRPTKGSSSSGSRISWKSLVIGVLKELKEQNITRFKASLITDRLRQKGIKEPRIAARVAGVLETLETRGYLRLVEEAERKVDRKYEIISLP